LLRERKSTRQFIAILGGCRKAPRFVRAFSGETLNGDWMLADVHMKGYPCPDTEASVYCHRDGRLRHLPDLSRPLSCSCGFACYKWRLIDDAPWRRCYVVLKPGAADLFAGREWCALYPEPDSAIVSPIGPSRP
jgi:hypothetical protein